MEFLKTIHFNNNDNSDYKKRWLFPPLQVSSEHVIVGTNLGQQRPNLALSFGSSFNNDDDDFDDDDVDDDDFDYDEKWNFFFWGPISMMIVLMMTFLWCC